MVFQAHPYGGILQQCHGNHCSLSADLSDGVTWPVHITSENAALGRVGIFFISNRLFVRFFTRNLVPASSSKWNLKGYDHKRSSHLQTTIVWKWKSQNCFFYRCYFVKMETQPVKVGVAGLQRGNCFLLPCEWLLLQRKPKGLPLYQVRHLLESPGECFTSNLPIDNHQSVLSIFPAVGRRSSPLSGIMPWNVKHSFAPEPPRWIKRLFYLGAD